jgi:STE24 endopeptidase
MIPLTPLLVLYLILFLAGTALDLVLTKMNVRRLRSHGAIIPAPFKEYIDGDKLRKITDYNVESQNFHILTSSIKSVFFVFVISSGLLVWFFGIVEGFGFGDLASGVIFFAGLGIVQGLFSLPFNYYQTFFIEQRHGFNTSTFRIWVTDILKGSVLGAVIGGILLVSALLLIQHGGNTWWFWAWLIFFVFQVVLLIIYPTLIAPWFNEFLPLKDATLEEKLKAIMHRAELSLNGVFEMDAGKRSRHSNAYFTGLGKTKRIVLFDTLLASHNHEEVAAIVAHEIGHWKKRHMLKGIALMGGFSFFALYLTSKLLTWPDLYQTFGFVHMQSCVGLFLVGILWDAVGQFLAPIGNALSRRFEREADFYAVGLLHQSAILSRALKRLAMDNLSNLHPHPAYAWFHYSHPPLSERIEYLERSG